MVAGSAVAIPDTPTTAEQLVPGALSQRAAELVPVHRRQAALPSAQEWRMLAGIANALANSEVIPKGLQGKAGNTMAVILKGRDLGLSPTESVWGIHMIEGMPTLAAHTMSALIKRAGHRLWYESTSRDGAVICAQRLERWDAQGVPVYGPVVSVEWTIQDAIDAKLVRKNPDGSLVAMSSSNKPKPWMLYPAAMLRARALTSIARMEFADVLMGAWYSPEELGADVDANGKVVRLPAPAEAAAAFDALVARREGADEQPQEPEVVRQAPISEGEALSDMIEPDAPTVVDVEAEPERVLTRDEWWARLVEHARVLSGGSLARHTARAVAAYHANPEQWDDEQLAEFVRSREGSYQRHIAEHPEDAPVIEPEAPTDAAEPEPADEATADAADADVTPEDEAVADAADVAPVDEQPTAEPTGESGTLL